MEQAYNGRAGMAIAYDTKGYETRGAAPRHGFCPIG